MDPYLFQLNLWLFLARLCSTQSLAWQPSKKLSGIGWYPFVQTRSTANREVATSSKPTIAHASTHASDARNSIGSGRVLITTPVSIPHPGPITRGSYNTAYIPSASSSRPAEAALPLSTTSSESTLQNLSITGGSSWNTAHPNLSVPKTSINYSSVASTHGVPLAALLRNIVTNGQGLSAMIIIPASKTKFIQSIESTEPAFQQFLNSMGGTVTSQNTCHRTSGGILVSMITLVGCAIDSLRALKAEIDIPNGNEPDFPSIEQNLKDIEGLSNKIAVEGGNENSDNRPSKDSGTSANKESTTSPSSSSSSRPSSSTLSRVLSTASSVDSSPIGEILGYRTPVLVLPDLYTIPVRASENILDIVGSALISAFYTTNSSNSVLLTLTHSRSGSSTVSGTRKVSNLLRGPQPSHKPSSRNSTFSPY